MYKGIKFIQIKPIKIILFVLIVSFLILLLGYHFELPNYYNESRDVIWQYIVKHPDISDLDVLRCFGNRQYWLQNGLFHIMTISCELLIIFLILNNHKIKTFFNIHRRVKIVLIYCFLNIAYIIWMNLCVKIVEIELNKYVYTSISDSIMIPIMGTYFLLFCVAFLYYPIVNIFNFIVFSTKISNKFLVVVYKIMFFILILCILNGMSALYNNNFICMHLISLIYLVVLYLSIKELEYKQDRK